jgi:hypothetical protein
MEYRLVTAWEYRHSRQSMANSLLTEVEDLLKEKNPLHIFKIKIPRPFLLSIPLFISGIILHATLPAQTTPQVSLSKITLPREEKTTISKSEKTVEPDARNSRPQKEKTKEIEEELDRISDQVQEVASGLEKGSLDEKAALLELSRVKDKLEENLDKDKGFLEFSVQSAPLIKLFNKLSGLDKAIAQMDSKALKAIMETISITIPIQVYDPNALQDSRFAPPDTAEGHNGAGAGGYGNGSGRGNGSRRRTPYYAHNKIGELIPPPSSRETIQNKQVKTTASKTTTGAPVTYFSVTHLPKPYQNVVRSYFGDP